MWALLKDAEISSSLKDIVFMRQLQCHSPIEKLYYSAKYSDICIYCAIAVPRWNYDKEQFYPQCADCSAKPAIENEHFKKRKKLNFVVCVVLLPSESYSKSQQLYNYQQTAIKGQS